MTIRSARVARAAHSDDAADSSVSVTTLVVDGHEFMVRRSGSAARRGTSADDVPVYLLLHGVGLSSRSYDSVARRLTRSGQVVALDLPGFGATRMPEHPLSVEAYARLIVILLDRLHLSRVVVVGHSMGAQFAVELAAQRPDLVARLVLIGPVVDDRRGSLTRQMLVLARDSALEPPRTNGRVFFDYLRCGPLWYLREVRMMLAYDILAAATRVSAPLLVIRGENDPIAREDWCARLSARAGSSGHVTIPSHRHVVIHTAPGLVADAIEALTGSVASETSAAPAGRHGLGVGTERP